MYAGRVGFFKDKTLTRLEPGPGFFLKTRPEVKKTRPIRVGSGRKPTELGFFAIPIHELYGTMGSCYDSLS